MKRSKTVFKVLACLLGAVLLVSAVPFSASAVSDAPADHLLLHYDFEGDTLADQLADKATAGKAESIAVFGEGITFSDGKAHIPATEGSYLKLDPSSDLASRKSELTVFMRFGASCTGNAWVAWMRNIGRVEYTDTKDAHSTMNVRVHTPTSSKDSATMKRVFSGHNRIISHENDMCNLAFTLSYDATAGSITVVAYIAYDGDGATTMTKMGQATQTGVIDTYLSDVTAKTVTLAYANADNNATTLMNATFDDVRVYDSVLSPEQISGIADGLRVEEKVKDEAKDATRATRYAGYQTTAYTDGYAKLRLIGTVKDMNKDGSLNDEYATVGFEVKMIHAVQNGKTWSNVDATTGKAAGVSRVYGSVLGMSNETAAVPYTAAELQGDYIFVATVSGIKQNVGDVIFLVKTFHDSTDGTRVYDDSYVIRLNTAA